MVTSNWNNIKRIDSTDENVAKFVFNNEDAVAEAVLYKYPTYKDRTVICCSTQSGCPVGCRFCGAGDYFVRSLRSSEIVDQVSYLIKQTRVPAHEMDKLQVMFMSMGEPLLNIRQLYKALQKLYDLYPNAKLLISTSAPDINYNIVNQFSKEIPTVGLQFSIHESTDQNRNKLIPFKDKLTLKQIAKKGREWYQSTGRRPFFNYCAHPENSSDSDANRLARLFKPSIWEATVSVICEREESIAAANKRQQELAFSFMQKLLKRGFSVRMFDPAGQDDIGGGCGQLWFVQSWMKENPKLARPSIGNGLHIVHTPT